MNSLNNFSGPPAPKSGPPVAVIVIVILVIIGIIVGIVMATRPVDVTTPAAEAAAVTTPAPAVTQKSTDAFTLVAGSSSPAYGKAGYKPIPLTNLPAKFTLKNSATGKYWGQNADQVTDAASGAIISAVGKSDIYSQTGTGTYTLTLNGDSTKSIRHAGYVMWYHNYAPGNFDFAWQLFLKDGTRDQVIVWNPYPGNNVGMYVKADGTRQRIDPGEPTIYTLTPSTSTTSGYTPEPFGSF
jgi:hypothetical protein